jgi:hypothetical protein
MSPTQFLVENAISYSIYERADGSYFVIIYGTPDSTVNITAVPAAELTFIRNGSNPTSADYLGITPGNTAWFALDSTGYLAVEYTTNVPTVEPTPTLAPTPLPLIPTPLLKFPNGFNTLINQAKIPANIKSYDSSAMNFYSTYNSTYGSWSEDNFITTSGTGPAAFSGIYLASTADPVYTFNCATGGYCGFSTGITNVHIPLGARTQNSGNPTCDCHLHLVEPVGWIPTSNNGTVWPNISPYQYEIDIEDAGTTNACVNTATVTCTTFNGGGSVYGTGAEVFSSGSTGFGGSTGNYPLYNGFGPANSQPGNVPTYWTGSANHGDIAHLAQLISAQDILSGAIQHEIGLRVVCAENSQSDAWPNPDITTDFSCSNIGSGDTGWAYEDHIVIERTDSQITSDVSSGVLTPIQGIVAKAMAHYGAVVYDTGYKGAPTFNIDVNQSDSAWTAVKVKYGLSTGTDVYGDPGININLNLPISYMKLYAHAVNSCVFQGTC